MDVHPPPPGIYREHLPSRDNLLPQDDHPFATAIADPDPFADPNPNPTAADNRVHLDPSQPTQQQPSQSAPAPQRKVPFYKRRKFIICQIVTAILGIVILFVLLFPVVKAIAQHVINASRLTIISSAIRDPTETTFQLDMTGNVSHTGIIPARIHFTQPINVTWEQSDGSLTFLGQIQNFPDISASHHRADVKASSVFTIANSTDFGRFTQFMISQPEFTWRLQSNSLEVHALKFPVAKGIHFNQKVTVPGINNFGGPGHVTLLDFQLPSDAPEGGINFRAVTSLINDSPFVVDLGTTVFNLTYNDIFLGLGTSPSTTLANGTNTITLQGRLVPHNDSQSDLEQLGVLFTNYINGANSDVRAKGISTTQTNGQLVSWLSQGLQALDLSVPFKPLQPINPIKNISIGTFNLSFSQENPFAPTASSDSITATLELPFGFTLNISQIQNEFVINQNLTDVASLKTPLGASISDIKVLSNNDTSGTINITISDLPLNVTEEEQSPFVSFNTKLTDAAIAIFQLIGNATAQADLPIGRINLTAINFNVSSGLMGLDGLRGSTMIHGVDVTGGSNQSIVANVGLLIHNPSNLNLQLGNLSLALFNQDAQLGTADFQDLKLEVGDNEFTVVSHLEPNNSPEGLQTLDNFVGRINTTLNIRGLGDASNIPSLLPAFETLLINTTLPGLNTTLLRSAALQVLQTTTSDNIAHVTVQLANPFTAGLTINTISSTVQSHGFLLGNIDTATHFPAGGKVTSTSPNLNLNMNLDPSSVFSLLHALAVDAGMPTEQIEGIASIGNIAIMEPTSADTPGDTSQKKRRKRLIKRELVKRNIFTGFDLPSFVQQAFKGLKTDINISTALAIGEYNTRLDYMQRDVPVATDETLNILLPFLAHPIVQIVVEGSLLGINNVLISNPAETSFGTALAGDIKNAGPFDALIDFPQGVTIHWSGAPLGTLNLPQVNVTGDVGAQLNNQGTFQVADVGHLTDFTKTLLTQESFDWMITGDNLTISALGIKVPGISLGQKNVTLKGFNGLKNGVKINSFDLPSNDAAGGIHLTLNTTINNPSQVGIALDHIGFQNFMGNTNLGPAASNGAFTLSPTSVIDLPLTGRLIPQTSDDGLATVSKVFTDFIHGLDNAVNVKGDTAGPANVQWLNDGIKALSLDTVLPSQGVLDVIKSIALNELQLLFTQDTAFAPSTSTNDATAGFQLPFGFPISIVEVGQTIQTSFQGTNFATLNVPPGPSTTDPDRVIHLQFNNVSFEANGNTHDTFMNFLQQTTATEQQTLTLSGSANTKAQTAVGLLSITDIAFGGLNTNIAGLQDLKAKPVAVSDVDVNSGSTQSLLIKLDTELFNPSNLTIGTGDVNFDLQFNGQTIGIVNLANLIIVPGSANYSTNVFYQPTGDALPTGQQLLTQFLEGIDSDTNIAGTGDTTVIQSLVPALQQILLSATLPAMRQNLISETTIQFPPGIVQNATAMATFTLNNPFTTSINLMEVKTAAVFQNITLGNIDANLVNNPIHAPGHANTTSPVLGLEFNIDPSVIIQLLTIRAQQQNIDLGPLPPLFQIALANPDLGKNITSTPDLEPPTCSSGQQFDVNAAILNALSGLETDLIINSTVLLDEFETPLNFVLKNVPANTDNSSLFLIGAVANPVVQFLVNQAELTFKTANISDITNEGFSLQLEGSLVNTGPLDALIEFPEPVTVAFQGQNIAAISLPPACAAANVGIPNYTPSANLTITDQAAFTNFATFLLHNEEFTWDLSSSAVRLTALSTIFSGVTLTKSVTFKAFNGLNGVTISNFQLPGDSPQGGITVSTDSMIPSPAQIGIDLGTVTFESFFQSVDLGPLTGEHLFLAAEATTDLHLDGRIKPQSGQDLVIVGELFSAFLQGKNSTLQVKGVSVDPMGNGQTVTWLSTAFQSLTLDVVLPGQANLSIIQTIDIQDLEIIMLNQFQAFAPLASSRETLATYKNPFGFSLQVIESATDITIESSGVNVAQLNIPREFVKAGVSTGNVAPLELSFFDLPLRSLNDAAFAQFFGAVTDTASVTTQLTGTADVIAKTPIGNVPIDDIAFNVVSKLAGINSFNHQTTLSDVKIIGSGGIGGSEFIVAPLFTTLNNPSNISLATIDISLPTFFNDVEIGRAVVNPFLLHPGKNIMPAQFHYEPANPNDTIAQSFLTEYLSTKNAIPLTIKGDQQSSPFGSLGVGLEGLSLSTSLTGINAKLISHINVFISVESLLTGFVTIDIDIVNPLDTDLTIKFLQSDAGVNGETFAQVDFAFDPPFVVPAHRKANSGDIPNVLLTQGVINSLPIIPLGELDVFSAITNQVGRDSGYTIPWLKYQQLTVPVTYVFTDGITASNVRPLAQSMQSSASASKAGKTSAIPSTSAPTTQTESVDSKPTAPSSSQAPATTQAAQASPLPVASNSPAPAAVSSTTAAS